MKPLRQHCMIDLETNDTHPTAQILSIGAVMFDPYETILGEEFYCTVDLESQQERTHSQATLDWWARQSKEAKAALTRVKPVCLTQALSSLRVFWRDCGAKYPWSHGSTFDIAILENAFTAEAPWQYWDIRDTRTLFWMANNHKPDRGPGHHDALADAKAQARAVQYCWRYLKGDGIRQ